MGEVDGIDQTSSSQNQVVPKKTDQQIGALETAIKMMREQKRSPYGIQQNQSAAQLFLTLNHRGNSLLISDATLLDRFQDFAGYRLL